MSAMKFMEDHYRREQQHTAREDGEIVVIHRLYHQSAQAWPGEDGLYYHTT